MGIKIKNHPYKPYGAKRKIEEDDESIVFLMGEFDHRDSKDKDKTFTEWFRRETLKKGKDWHKSTRRNNKQLPQKAARPPILGTQGVGYGKPEDDALSKAKAKYRDASRIRGKQGGKAKLGHVGETKLIVRALLDHLTLRSPNKTPRQITGMSAQSTTNRIFSMIKYDIDPSILGIPVADISFCAEMDVIKYKPSKGKKALKKITRRNMVNIVLEFKKSLNTEGKS